MARPSQQNKKPAPPPGSPIRDQDGDTPMANATPTKAAQEARERSSSILETPTRAPRSSLLGRSLPKEDITTPRRLRSTSTASSINEAIVPTPGMVPRSRSAKNNQSMPPSTPQRGAKTSTSTATPGLPALPPSMTPGMGLSSLASSSSFRSSVLAGERPMPETPAKATMGTPKEMPERRRSTRFMPRDSIGPISPENISHRRASEHFQLRSSAAHEAEQKGKPPKRLTRTSSLKSLLAPDNYDDKEGKEDDDVEEEKKD